MLDGLPIMCCQIETQQRIPFPQPAFGPAGFFMQVPAKAMAIIHNPYKGEDDELNTLRFYPERNTGCGLDHRVADSLGHPIRFEGIQQCTGENLRQQSPSDQRGGSYVRNRTEPGNR